jgi:hypothetical protein
MDEKDRDIQPDEENAILLSIKGQINLYKNEKYIDKI